jgi:hypothetical protein
MLHFKIGSGFCRIRPADGTRENLNVAQDQTNSVERSWQITEAHYPTDPFSRNQACAATFNAELMNCTFKGDRQTATHSKTGSRRKAKSARTVTSLKLLPALLRRIVPPEYARAA